MYLLTRNNFKNNSLFYISTINEPNGSEKNIIEIFNYTKSRFLMVDQKPNLSSLDKTKISCSFLSLFNFHKFICFYNPKIFSVSYKNSLKILLMLLFSKKRITVVIRHSIEEIFELKCITYLLILNIFKKKINRVIYNSFAAQKSNSIFFKKNNIVVYNPKQFAKEKIINFQKRRFDIIYVGRNHPDKNPDLIYSISKQLLKFNKNLKILIVGLKRNKFSNLSNVTSLPYQKNINYHLNNSKLLLITSKTESLPNILVEAMHIGTLVLCPKVGDIPLFIDNNLFIHNYKTHEICNQILGILRMDSVSIKKIQAMNMAMIKNKFSSENFSIYQ